MVSTQKKDYRLLFLILGLAFVLRFAGIQFGLPHLYHADEPIVVNHALAYGSGDFNPHFFKIPPLVSYLLFGIYGFYFLLGKCTGFFHSPQDFEYLFYSNPASFYFLGRLILGCLAGTATVYALYRLCRKHFSESHALLSAFFMAVCFLHVKDSHYIYADIPLLLVLVASFFVSFRIQDRGFRLKDHLWAGVLIGGSAAMKYNGVAIVFPYLLATLLSNQRDSAFKGWIFAGLMSCAVYLLLNPYSLLDYRFFISEIKQQSASQGGGGWSHYLKYSLSGGLGMPLLAASLAGIARLGWAFDKKKAVMALFIFVYYAILAGFGQPYDRYVLPLVPFLIFFAADFLIFIFLKIDRINLKPFWMKMGLVIFLSLQPLLASLLFDRIMLAKDTRTLAKEWVENHIPSGSPLALDWDFYMPRLRFSQKQLEDKKQEVSIHPGTFSKAQNRRLDYMLSNNPLKQPGYDLYFFADELDKERFLFAQPLVLYDLDVLRQTGIKYVLITRINPSRERLAFYNRLEKEGKRVAIFSPYRDSSRMVNIDSITMTGGPFLWRDLMARKRNGAVIEVYSLE